MATYTSVQNGNWNDSATWGGSGYPSAAGDNANIGHTVTYNVVSATALGAITINSNGILTFSTVMSTKLTLGNQDITVNNGGELRVGTSGAIIPKQYTAELVWGTGSDNSKGINIASGGKFNAYGDPDYYGSILGATLQANWTSVAQGTTGVNIYLNENVGGKWLNGHLILVHFGRDYNYNGDSLGASDQNKGFALLTLTAAATWDGTKSTLTGTLTSYTGPVGRVFLAGADVMHVSRNVHFYMSNYNKALGNYNSSRPRFVSASAAHNINDTRWSSWYSGPSNGGYGSLIGNSVIANGLNGWCQPGQLTIITNCITYSNNNGGSGCSAVSVVGGYWCNNTTAISLSYPRSSAKYVRIFGNSSFGFACGMDTSYIYSNNIGPSIVGQLLKNCVIGWNPSSNANQPVGVNLVQLNVIDFSFAYPSPSGFLMNCKIPSSPSFNYRNSATYSLAQIKSEHHQQVPGAQYTYDNMGDIFSVAVDAGGSPIAPTVNPPSGQSTILKVNNLQSGITTATYVEVFRIRVWAVADVAKTYKFFVQWYSPTAHTLANTEISLYADYMAGADGTLTTLASTQAVASRSGTTDWSQYLSVTVNPHNDGFIDLYLQLFYYESGTPGLFVDPGFWIDGNLAICNWSQGGLIYPGPVAFGGGGNPALLPLGIMEVVN